MAEVKEQPPRMSIPATAGGQLVMLAAPDGSEAEAYRSLRTFLRFDARLGMGGGTGRVVLLADGGGVPERAAIIANLGIAFALAGERTILVDADLRSGAGQGSVSGRFGQEGARAGLTSILAGPTPGHKVVLPLVGTEVEHLLLLPAGPRISNPADLLGAEAFAVLVAALRGQADIVLIDAPPIADFADARAIAARVDATVLLVAQGITRRPAAQATLASLRQVGADVLGVVLTEAR